MFKKDDSENSILSRRDFLEYGLAAVSFAPTLPALRMRKHVYCEKPLTRDVREARRVIEAARKAGAAT